VLETVCRVAAPLLPLVTDEVYGGLTGGGSVHLADWPAISSLPTDRALVDAMDRVRDVCSATLSVRKAHGRRVRLPLRSLTVSFAGAEALRPYVDIIADEVNVKSVVLSTEAASDASFVLQPIPAALGPRLGPRTQEVIRAVKAGNWKKDGDRVIAGDIELFDGEYTLKLAAAEGSASTTLSGGDGTITLDTEVTPELAAEGTARDLIRLVQQARRDAGLDVSDRIDVTLGVPESVRRQIQPHLDMVAAETLADSVSFGAGEPNASLDDDDVHIGVTRTR